MELTIVMPCLNEAETLATCIRKADRLPRGVRHRRRGRRRRQRQHRRQPAARDRRRRPRRAGHGQGLRQRAHGRHRRRPRQVRDHGRRRRQLRLHQPHAVRRRAARGLRPGHGQPLPGRDRARRHARLHKYLGNPVLSFIGRLFFPSAIGDFHCGLRGFTKESALRARACRPPAWSSPARWSSRPPCGARRSPRCRPRCKKDGRSRPPHLRRWRDGWRHLRFLLLFSPRWLFLVPGAMLFLLGLMAGRSSRPARSPSGA